MNRKRGKKAQGSIGISFSTIFSIILIIFFLVVAFIVIKSFISTKKCAEIGLFSDDLKKAVERAWNSQKDDFPFKANLPSKLEYVCFINFSKSIRGRFEEVGIELSIFEGIGDNLYLYPIEHTCNTPSYYIEHLDFSYITRVSNPYCVPVVDGVVRLNIKKEFNEGLVKIH